MKARLTKKYGEWPKGQMLTTNLEVENGADDMGAPWIDEATFGAIRSAGYFDEEKKTRKKKGASSGE